VCGSGRGILSALVGIEIRQRESGTRGFVLNFRVGRVIIGVGELPPCLAEREVSADVTIIGLTMEANAHLTINGRNAYDCVYFGGEGPPLCTTANIVFPGDNVGRGWPVAGRLSLVIPVSAQRLVALRNLISAATEVVWTRLERLDDPDIVAAMEAGFYTAVDSLILEADRPSGPKRLGRYAERMRELLHQDPNCRLRSADIASAVGISGRTLNAVCNALFGMSPHQYLRQRRLYRVRAAILASRGQGLVKQCALSYGFWHLGQFARDYWLTFGETLAQTLQWTQSD
jgi:AraC family ethanolamine operon transcriptional activator